MALKESDKKALAFMSVALIGGGIYMYALPMYDEHQKRLQEIENLVGELRIAHKKAENMSGLVAEVDLLKFRLSELNKVLPSESGTFELIEKMQQVAAKSGVQISSIVPEDRKEKGEGWKADGIIIRVTCYWYQFIDFVWRLENYERLIDVQSINLQPEALQPGVKLQKFTVEMRLSIYSSTLTEA